MQSIAQLISALVFALIHCTNARADPCTEINPVAPGSGYTIARCIAQQQSEITELKGRLAVLNDRSKILERVAPLLKDINSSADMKKTLDELVRSLFGDVDSVYTVTADWDLSSGTFPTGSTYVYVNPKQHIVTAWIYAKGMVIVGTSRSALTFDLFVNRRNAATNVQRLKEEDLTDKCRIPLQGAGGAGRQEEEGTDFANATPDFIHLVQIKPNIPDLSPGQSYKPGIVSVQGYILVSRKSFLN